MQFKLSVVAALAAAASAAVTPARLGCGTHDPTPEHIEISKKLAEEEAANNGTMSLMAAATINVNVYFHVVASSQTVANGYITDKMLADQLAVMNSDFAPHGISYTLVETTRTINANWAQDGDEMAMKRALRKGTYKDLNLYFVRTLGGDFGYCYFPTTAAAGSTAYIRDGCTILSSTVPGGSETNYNLGKTVTHEVGHWFGLYHTFQGGCTGEGDSIADTPAQASFSTGCPTGRDSCPSQEFTPNQQTRMYSFWNQYRA
ncbi:metalloprotease [Colletotrichum scovillei]|uniref:metalloprotease n=1 Tax=Colletotrichum scovillei TaxID=1209932 RepID=UPI0015C31097|nr:metalloprotease [Colletotrichum scovillei]KAF4775891.1 metalloprotease [Colletotrichum scovillei]